VVLILMPKEMFRMQTYIAAHVIYWLKFVADLPKVNGLKPNWTI
jgi:hypothetical protein